MKTIPELKTDASFNILSREDLEKQEEKILSPAAKLSCESVGRSHSVTPDPYRTDFMRDCDRILHCKSFRRLSHKTQVFVAPEGDHYRTRLTHTLEVSQIARSVARSLGLNVDLTLAIALGHDLGHTPFGHVGEAALSNCLAKYYGVEPQDEQGMPLYRHNVQSVRVVDVLENDGKGLNLTREVVDGIYCHTGKKRAKTFEGRIVAIADRIAYINHDIDDAIRAGLLKENDLPKSTHEVLGTSSSERITTLNTDLIVNSQKVGDVMLSDTIWEAMNELRDFLFKHVYFATDARLENPKAQKLVEALFGYYIEHLDEVPEEYTKREEDDPCIQVVDYVSGMTDRYAIRLYENLFIPRAWRL